MKRNGLLAKNVAWSNNQGVQWKRTSIIALPATDYTYITIHWAIFLLSIIYGWMDGSGAGWGLVIGEQTTAERSPILLI